MLARVDEKIASSDTWNPMGPVYREALERIIARGEDSQGEGGDGKGGEEGGSQGVEGGRDKEEGTSQAKEGGWDSQRSSMRVEEGASQGAEGGWDMGEGTGSSVFGTPEGSTTGPTPIPSLLNMPPLIPSLLELDVVPPRATKSSARREKEKNRKEKVWDELCRKRVEVRELEGRCRRYEGRIERGERELKQARAECGRLEAELEGRRGSEKSEEKEKIRRDMEVAREEAEQMKGCTGWREGSREERES